MKEAKPKKEPKFTLEEARTHFEAMHPRLKDILVLDALQSPSSVVRRSAAIAVARAHNDAHPQKKKGVGGYPSHTHEK